MKKLLFIAIVAVSLGANAQIEAGKLMIGGSFGFGTSSGESTNTMGSTSTTTKDNSTMSFNLIPQVGYMINENLGAGLGIGYDYSKTTQFEAFDNGTDKFDNISKEGTFYISPFVRYYKNTGERAYAFGEFALPIGMGSYNDLKMNDNNDGVIDNDPRKVFTFATQLSVGFNYFLNDRCALEAKWAGLEYKSSTYSQEGTTGNVDWKNEDKRSNFGLGLDMTAISVGLRIFL